MSRKTRFAHLTPHERDALHAYLKALRGAAAVVCKRERRG